MKYTHEKLRPFRKSKGVSQTFISKHIGYRHPSGYSNIEHGRAKASVEQAVKIAKLLGTTVDELFFN